ncbi:19183_t:CDS:2 [Gigaspora margarita]|uniref:19183_t:CDS:1 n=1 Tax=Gigaspora margarita TaxID=4874 RepID=A0ABN7UTQ4_GIGMA|nr:19183_t:CDS:2 [Gigaspora margarita]
MVYYVNKVLILVILFRIIGIAAIIYPTKSSNDHVDIKNLQKREYKTIVTTYVTTKPYTTTIAFTTCLTKVPTPQCDCTTHPTIKKCCPNALPVPVCDCLKNKTCCTDKPQDTGGKGTTNKDNNNNKGTSNKGNKGGSKDDGSKSTSNNNKGTSSKGKGTDNKGTGNKGTKHGKRENTSPAAINVNDQGCHVGHRSFVTYIIVTTSETLVIWITEPSPPMPAATTPPDLTIPPQTMPDLSTSSIPTLSLSTSSLPTSSLPTSSVPISSSPTLSLQASQASNMPASDLPASETSSNTRVTVIATSSASNSFDNEITGFNFVIGLINLAFIINQII